MDTAKLKIIPEMGNLKTRLKTTWVSGDFGKIAESFTKGAADFVKKLNLANGTRVLDAACGTGNQSIPAARTGALVTGIDIAPNLLEQARSWAVRENLDIKFDEGDVESLPYADAEFDVVMSMFGAMFAPRPAVVAAELMRVCRAGGTIAMANWTPNGFIGQMFKIVGSYVPLPPEMPSPLLWGDSNVVHERLLDGISQVWFQPQTISFNFPFDIPQTIEFWRRFYGPVNKAFGFLDEKGQEALRKDLENLWRQHNLVADGTTFVESEYLEVRAIRQK